MRQARHEFSELDLMLMRHGWPVADPSAWRKANAQRRAYAWQQFCAYLAPRLAKLAEWTANQAGEPAVKPA